MSSLRGAVYILVFCVLEQLGCTQAPPPPEKFLCMYSRDLYEHKLSPAWGGDRAHGGTLAEVWEREDGRYVTCTHVIPESRRAAEEWPDAKNRGVVVRRVRRILHPGYKA